MQYYRPMTARVTMEPTRPDLTLVTPEPPPDRANVDAGEHGLQLFRSGRTREAMPFLEQGAGDGDARAQYVYATALFNGDNVLSDVTRAFDLMQRASDAGLPQATESLAKMRALTAAAAHAEALGDDPKDIEALLSDEVIARCRAMLDGISRRAPPPDYAADTLATMVQELLVLELRERLETLLPGAIERAVGSAQARPGAARV